MANREKKGKPSVIVSGKRIRPPAVFARLEEADYAELTRRRMTTGAPLGAQVRILVHKALHARKVIS